MLQSIVASVGPEIDDNDDGSRVQGLGFEFACGPLYKSLDCLYHSSTPIFYTILLCHSSGAIFFVSFFCTILLVPFFYTKLPDRTYILWWDMIDYTVGRHLQQTAFLSTAVYPRCLVSIFVKVCQRFILSSGCLQAVFLSVARAATAVQSVSLMSKSKPFVVPMASVSSDRHQPEVEYRSTCGHMHSQSD
jgi:hypothetical protein